MTDAERQLEVVKAELVNARRVIDLLREGWEVEPASLYDEEGVEGWVWVSPNDNEQAVIGGWDEIPPTPDDILNGK